MNEGVGLGPIAEVAGLTSDVNVGISNGPIYLIMGPNGVKDISGSMVAKSIKKGVRKGKRRFGWKIPFSLFKKKKKKEWDTVYRYSDETSYDIQNVVPKHGRQSIGVIIYIHMACLFGGIRGRI